MISIKRKFAMGIVNRRHNSALEKRMFLCTYHINGDLIGLYMSQHNFIIMMDGDRCYIISQALLSKQNKNTKKNCPKKLLFIFSNTLTTWSHQSKPCMPTLNSLSRSLLKHSNLYKIDNSFVMVTLDIFR